MDVDKYVALVKAALKDLAVDESVAQMVESDISKLVETVDQRVSDGIDVADVAAILGEATHTLMAVMERTGLPGDKKQAYVVELVWRIYQLVDKGVDGDKNRINIPWVPEPLESKIEHKVVGIATILAIKAAHKFMQKK